MAVDRFITYTPTFGSRLSDPDSIYVIQPDGSKSLLTQSATDANNNVTGLVGTGGVIPTLQVNIIPRSGTLLDLLAISGGAGEVSVATDWNAQVLHNGVINGAKVLTCKAKSAQAFLGTAQAGVVTAVSTKLAIDTIVSDSFGMFSAGINNHIVVPAGANRMMVYCGCTFAAHATGRRLVFPRLNGATIALNFGNTGFSGANSGTDSTTVIARVESAPCVPGDLITAWVSQTSGVDMSLGLSTSSFLHAAFWRE